MPDSARIDLAALARQARRITADLESVKEELGALQATGLAGDGLVAATVSGDGRLLKVEIDPAGMDPDDPQRLGELIVLAVEEAHQALVRQRQQQVERISGGFEGLVAGLHPPA